MLAGLQAYKAHDMDWKSGRVWCYVYNPGDEAVQIAKDTVKEFKADGIIFQRMKFCDPWAGDAHNQPLAGPEQFISINGRLYGPDEIHPLEIIRRGFTPGLDWRGVSKRVASCA